MALWLQMGLYSRLEYRSKTGQLVEDGAGNVETGDGEDADVLSGNGIHIAAQDRAADRVSMVLKR